MKANKTACFAGSVPTCFVPTYFDPVAPDYICFNRMAAVRDFVRHCRRAGVRKVVQVCMANEGDVDAVPALEAAGIAARREVVEFDDRQGRLERIKRAAFERVYATVAERARAEGELVFFADDFLAFGGIVALLAKGIRMPEEVKIVVWANSGFAPVGPWSVTRMELDPVANAEVVARHVLKRLNGGDSEKRGGRSVVHRGRDAFVSAHRSPPFYVGSS